MPIRVKEGLPAIEILANENIFIMTENRAKHQDIRALEILVVNLMPTIVATETQLLRLLSNTSLQLNVEFLKLSTQQVQNPGLEHLQQFYLSFEAIKNKSYDGMIITGASAGQLEFEQIDCWNELCRVMEWSKYHVNASLYLCGAAYAALYYYYGVKKTNLSEKLSGVYTHTVNKREHPIVRGFDDLFLAPHSRWVSVDPEALHKTAKLDILAESKQAGVYLITDKNSKQLFVTGHCEFDRPTLEAACSGNDGGDTAVPCQKTSWSSHASLLFANWINYYVYQQTPYCLQALPYRRTAEKVNERLAAK
jgi:homoserine O-succinyltransferase